MARIIKYVVLIIILLSLKYVICFRCDRRPYGSTTQPSAPDGRFKLSVVGVEDAYYIPEQLYTVQISETDGESRFSGFMISAEGDIRQDPDNPRRVVSLSPGNLRPQNTMTSKFSDRCLNSVEHAMSSTKSSVEVYWQAPSSNSGCVTLRAMVAENEDVWFEDGTPLTQTLCEDLRQPDDVTPQMNFQCEICDEAKYEVSFTGIWSRNTHPLLYPENDWIPRFSDLVGASHSVDFILWSPGSVATEGFKVLAQYANSSELEAEILKKIGDGVRTLIKGKGHGYPKMGNPTYSFFRTDNTNHLFTVAIAIYPSPDWFLGVSRFELCQKDNTWLKEREINLYLWDAGTDSGVSYESADILTFPQQAITRVQMSSFDRNSPFFEVDLKDMHPFGKLHVKLIRTYQRECKEATTTTSSDEVTDAEDKNNIPTSLSLDPESPEECPMSQWQEWSPCYGTCVDGKIAGYKWRNRYYIVDGTPTENYEIKIDPSTPEEVVSFCENNFEKDECEDDCSQKDNVSTTTPSDELTEEKNEETSEPETPSSESPIGIDPESLQNCPMSQWEEWSPCYGACVDGKIVGYNWRKRYHIVDGTPVESNDPNADTSTTKVSRFCKRYFKDFQKEKCRDDCSEEENEAAMTPSGEGTEDKNEESSEPETPSSEAPIVTDPESPPDCPISQWQEWSPCDGACVDGKIEGYKWRERYHLVDGIPVEKYDPNADPSTIKEVSSICKNYLEDFQKEKCKDDCSEEDDNDKINVERRVMVPVAPGNKWSSNRRELHRH